MAISGYIDLPLEGGGSTDSFSIIQPDSGTSPTASGPNDTLSLTSSDKTITIVGNSSTDTIDFKAATEFDASTSGTSKTIDFSNGAIQTLELNANCILTFSNPGSAGAIYILRLVQDSTGGRSVTFPGSVKWSGGTAPTLSAANKVDLINFYFDGTNYLGSFSLNY